MDIEGSEPLALKGARTSLLKGIIKAIYIEVSTENLRRQGKTTKDSIDPLRESGFNLFWCKAQDFDSFPQLARSGVRILSRCGSFMVSPIDYFPEDYQTDILALHCDTPLMTKLRETLDSGVPDGSVMRELLF
jgi:hypothetical protein